MTVLHSPGLGPSTSRYTQLADPAPWPEPEMPARDVEPGYQGKRAVLELVRFARDRGWMVRVTCAKGAWPTVAGRPSRQRFSLCVQMRRGTERAVAVYVEGVNEDSPWAWETLYRWTLGEFPTKIANITALRAVL